jgi:hypothetical protein
MNRWVASSCILSPQRSVAHELRFVRVMRPIRLVMVATKIRTTHVLAFAFLVAVRFPSCLGQVNQTDAHVTPRITYAPAPDGGGPRYEETERIKATVT